MSQSTVGYRQPKWHKDPRAWVALAGVIIAGLSLYLKYRPPGPQPAPPTASRSPPATNLTPPTNTPLGPAPP